RWPTRGLCTAGHHAVGGTYVHVAWDGGSRGDGGAGAHGSRAHLYGRKPWDLIRRWVPLPLHPGVSGDYIDWSRFEAWENTPKTRYRLSREVDDEIDRGRLWSRQCLRSVLSVARPYTPASAFRLPEAPVRYGSAKRWAQAGLLPFVSCGSSPAKSQTCR